VDESVSSKALPFRIRGSSCPFSVVFDVCTANGDSTFSGWASFFFFGCGDLVMIFAVLCLGGVGTAFCALGDLTLKFCFSPGRSDFLGGVANLERPGCSVG